MVHTFTTYLTQQVHLFQIQGYLAMLWLLLVVVAVVLPITVVRLVVAAVPVVFNFFKTKHFLLAL
jgi:ABC-type sulfate transport system permease subunit